MKDLRSYGNNTTKIPPQEELTAAEQLTRRALAAYNGKSDLFLLAQIVKQAERDKKAGKLTNEELETFYGNFSPMLQADHRKKLRQVIDQLKNI